MMEATTPQMEVTVVLTFLLHRDLSHGSVVRAIELLEGAPVSLQGPDIDCCFAAGLQGVSYWSTCAGTSSRSSMQSGLRSPS